MQYGTAVSVLSRLLGRAGRGEDAVARYVIAETASGRTLDAVLADSDVIDAVGGDAVKALRARLGELRAP
jgi:hypothetical protein